MSTKSDRVPGWTHARYNAFIVSALRLAWRKYPPKNLAIKLANIDKHTFWCVGIDGRRHQAPKSIGKGKKRKNMRFVDHIESVTKGGNVDWNTRIDRMFCAVSNLQVMCKSCHDIKTMQDKGQNPKTVEFKKKNAEGQKTELKKLGLPAGSNAKKRLEIFEENL